MSPREGQRDTIRSSDSEITLTVGPRDLGFLRWHPSGVKALQRPLKASLSPMQTLL